MFYTDAASPTMFHAANAKQVYSKRSTIARGTDVYIVLFFLIPQSGRFGTVKLQISAASCCWNKYLSKACMHIFQLRDIAQALAEYTLHALSHTVDTVVRMPWTRRHTRKWYVCAIYMWRHGRRGWGLQSNFLGIRTFRKIARVPAGCGSNLRA